MDRNTIIRDSVFLTLVKLLSLGLNILTTAVLSRELTLESYGSYSQAVLINSFVVSITVLGLSDATNFFFNKNASRDNKDYINTIFTLQIVIGMLSSLIVFLSRGTIVQYFKNIELYNILIVMLFSPMITNMTNSIQILLISIGKSSVLALRSILFSIIRLIIVFIFTQLNLKLTFFIFTIFVVDLISFVFFLNYFRLKQYPIKLIKFNSNMVKEILRFSIPMSIFTILKYLMKDMDRLFIGRFESTEVMAIYTNGSYQLPIDLFASTLILIIMPPLTKGLGNFEFKKVANLLNEYISLSFITTISLGVIVLILSKEIFITLFGLQYLQGIPIFNVYIISHCLRFANISIVLSSSGKTKILMYISVFTLLLNFLLNYVFYFNFGIIGPALATLISSLVNSIVLLRYSIRVINSNITDIFELKTYLKFSLSILFASIIAVYLRSYLSSIFSSSLVTIFIVSSTYLIAIFIFNFCEIRKSIYSLRKIT